jgi:hypothetical protein
MMFNEIEAALENFGDYVVQQSRSNLTKGKHNFKSDLYKSITYEIDTTTDGVAITFSMEEYGNYQDQGVRGVGGVRKTTSKYNSRNNRGKMWKQKGGDSPFSFKQGNKPSVKHFTQWSKAKGLSPFAVRDAVFFQGIKPTQFFSKPFGKALERLPKELYDSLVIDVDQEIVIITKN